jgi:hypothetical protein
VQGLLKKYGCRDARCVEVQVWVLNKYGYMEEKVV